MKKNYKKIVALLIVMTLLVACGGNTDGGKKKIGFSISTLNNPFFVTMRDEAQKVADENEMELIVLDANDNTSKQLNDVEDLLQQKVDVLIVNPTDSDAIVTAVEAANDLNIPVIAIDRSANGGDITSYIASDNVHGGRLAGDFIAKELGEKGKVIELEGIAGTSPARDRGKGFNEAIKEYKDIEVIAKQTANFDRAQGLTVMENLLQAHPDIDAVFAHNDEMALGALEAIQASGRSIVVVGFDATDDAKVAVENGTLNATVEEQAGLMGQTGILTAIKIINGESYESEIPLEVSLITK